MPMKRPMKSAASPPNDDPLWYKDAVIYQVHVKSFFDKNNDGVGDFIGLMEKLDYIAELGVTAIWLLPFYPSPRRDDGYDISSYRAVHEEYGTLADLRRLIDAAHQRGIRVITELVINHTSDQHPWFQRARAAKPGSAARNYYVWSDNDQKYDGTRIIFIDTEKSNWTWDAVAGAYYWHRFYSHQPDLNFDNPRVLHDVLAIMRFWLDLGVDGLRLDAVPYLVEREGTNNENLPETHAILKQIREAMDRHSPGRMLLAEANQWPEDAQQYFGNGDECHMAFHFPLMPRMYMAIAQEDRFPISDIMRQTPAIPESCQWAVFLRNHDELTLEMVTDSERDYLWETYAGDRRARLNLGIRRRLAPLLEHDRRRIELMNGLLLSMPGTPVIYYGDEIGMGDNIHLGDRDGVRTPMQWSPDRNGGFSRVNPAQLVLPPIMDPIYGYQSVNVEAQAADSHSLLNWMRRMLAMRSRHRAFGRGTLRFLYPGNRKILAYIREFAESDDEDEVILCVYNLSRTAQAVELDLSALAGRAPVDLLGGSPFPPVGELPYMLTLPPYAFYWFSLASEGTMPSWRIQPSESLPEFATLVMRNGLSDVLNTEARRVLETESLPNYLARRRWFAGKDRQIKAATLGRADIVGSEETGLLLAEVNVEAGETQETYQVPLSVNWDDETTNPLVQQLALARIRRHRRVGYLTDAFALDTLPHNIIANLRDSTRIELKDGEIRFLPTTQIDDLPLTDDAEIRRFSAEQSNSSMIVGDAAIIKVLRRIESGLHPETEMSRFLTEAGYANTPALLGEVIRSNADGQNNTLIVVQRFVRNQGDAWQWTLDSLGRAVDTAIHAKLDEAGEADALASYLPFAATMGRRLAEMHAILATPTESPDFNPLNATEGDAKEWVNTAHNQLGAAFAALARARDHVEDAVAEEIDALIAARGMLEAALPGLGEAGIGTLKTRIHGDFHLGQILAAQGDAYLIDFEGEPAKPLALRRAKASPLRDVAGLLRSFDYAAASVERATFASTDRVRERRQSILTRFVVASSASFTDAYRSVAAEAVHPWVAEGTWDRLLSLFLIEKAAYEICYETANRPSWLDIPLGGLIHLCATIAEGEFDAGI
ncbi:maltose alpha-D-glucosyltransferase [Acidiphilium sp. AL]|uniref:Maltokinase n=2 Tax=Acidocellaceae TaxID=3385905 RepID=A0ABS9DVJ7_9PROT|nr:MULTISPECIES: maltose alpha-D-glucosyltransferase [Acidiphilium]MCF3946158.1 maltose alpha-D-glucosyltransferase [Acidiphilium iwatense]MCU4158502.1 maltose alpha-D-glucosyltransferase [Acidiphilium sp. AL]